MQRKTFLQEQAEKDVNNHTKKMAQYAINDAYINYFKSIVGTARYRNHKFR